MSDVFSASVDEVVAEYVFNKNLTSTLDEIVGEVVEEVGEVVGREGMEVEGREETRRVLLDEVVGAMAREVGEEGEGTGRGGGVGVIDKS